MKKVYPKTEKEKKRVLDEYEARRKKGILRTKLTPGEPPLTLEEQAAIAAKLPPLEDDSAKDPYALDPGKDRFGKPIKPTKPSTKEEKIATIAAHEILSEDLKEHGCLQEGYEARINRRRGTITTKHAYAFD